MNKIKNKIQMSINMDNIDKNIKYFQINKTNKKIYLKEIQKKHKKVKQQLVIVVLIEISIQRNNGNKYNSSYVYKNKI